MVGQRSPRQRRRYFPGGCRCPLKRGVVRAHLLVAPVPNVVEEAPGDIVVALHQFGLGPEVPRVEPRKLLEVVEDLCEVGGDL